MSKTAKGYIYTVYITDKIQGIYPIVISSFSKSKKGISKIIKSRHTNKKFKILYYHKDRNFPILKYKRRKIDL